jgi:Uma2 family endonuclease
MAVPQPSPDVAASVTLPHMNMLVRPEAPERVRFTLDDVLHMQSEGMFGDVDVELIEGEIYAMPAEGDLHLELKIELSRLLTRTLDDPYRVVVDGTLSLADGVNPSPDIWIYAQPGLAADKRGPDVLLLIEIAVSSKAHDLGLKARIYREHGVREYWVIEPDTGVTHIHKLDSDWPGAPTPFQTPLRPALLPGLEINLSTLTPP